MGTAISGRQVLPRLWNTPTRKALQPPKGCPLCHSLRCHTQTPWALILDFFSSRIVVGMCFQRCTPFHRFRSPRRLFYAEYIVTIYLIAVTFVCIGYSLEVLYTPPPNPRTHRSLIAWSATPPPIPSHRSSFFCGAEFHPWSPVRLPTHFFIPSLFSHPPKYFHEFAITYQNH